ncbi:7340_t:CDS:2 [Acaulospora morrowiae]|uniref:Ribose-5-phosphate isomerase n=1 Tax=Acaulospora morrowiae TaxID=94023 RepID=A0A9N9CBN7_9GLOM|nr:7340_t:CDS:2 [Acaulospora morrowiae]
MTSKSVLTNSKRLAAYKAVDNHLDSSTRIVGIGSGSTVVFVIERILQRGGLKEAENEKLKKLDVNNCVFIPTSFQSRQLIVDNGLNLGDVDQYPVIDITIDGADEVDDNLNAIKGGGACHLREKVVAEISKKFIIVADYTKESKVLGEKWTQGVPIEVIPFCYTLVLSSLKKLGCPSPNLRMAKAKAGPIITDNGNFVIDAHFGPLDGTKLFDNGNRNTPGDMMKQIKLLTGVVEVGLFIDMAEIVYIGCEDGINVKHIKKGE